MKNEHVFPYLVLRNFLLLPVITKDTFRKAHSFCVSQKAAPSQQQYCQCVR